MRRIGAGRQLEVCSMSVVCIYVREEISRSSMVLAVGALLWGLRKEDVGAGSSGLTLQG